MLSRFSAAQVVFTQASGPRWLAALHAEAERFEFRFLLRLIYVAKPLYGQRHRTVAERRTLGEAAATS